MYCFWKDDQGARIDQPTIPKLVDLKKIFTPALDAPDIDYTQRKGKQVFENVCELSFVYG